MRRTLLAALLFLPQVLLAQFDSFNDFKPGSYVLKASPTVRTAGMLKLRHNDQLVINKFRAKDLTLKPADIASFRLEARKYVTVNCFSAYLYSPTDNAAARKEMLAKVVDFAFAEQVDSGQVVLLRYDYLASYPSTVGPGGMMQAGGRYVENLYLVSKGSSWYPIPSHKPDGGQKFREALLPQLASRPDLTKLVEENRATADDIPDIIYALNTGKSFRAITMPAK